MNKKMTAAILYGKEDIRIEEVNRPQIGPGDVLVKVKCALTCGTDLKVYKRGYHSKMIHPPAIFGHEFSGTIEQIGNNVSEFQLDMRVVAANSAPCHVCYYCQKDQFNLCEDLLFINGAYAEYMLVPERVVQRNLYRLENQVSFKEAAMTEPLACAIKGLDDTKLSAGDSLLLLGTGPLSLMFVQLAKLKKAQVWITGRSKEKLELASKLGADKTILLTELKDVVQEIRQMTPEARGFDVVIDGTGVPECWEQAIQWVRKGGVVNLFGGCPSGTTIKVPTEDMHYGSLTLIASFHHTPSYIKESLRLISKGLIDTKTLIQKERPLKEVPQIYSELAKPGNHSPKTAILP